jgi:putative Mn2+ efflux pump MntP
MVSLDLGGVGVSALVLVSSLLNAVVVALVGFTLLLFGFVLGARALALTFREQHFRGTGSRQ